MFIDDLKCYTQGTKNQSLKVLKTVNHVLRCPYRSNISAVSATTARTLIHSFPTFSESEKP